MPLLPEDALQGSDAPGLHITYATDEFLLAAKLVAQRRKDAADIVSLARRLELILGGKDVDREIHLLAIRAERLVGKSSVWIDARDAN
ncbi:hypothetical protein GCM10009789_67100 [Kribbella sancticallisti]|uniref:Uncharacterized protein n=1 Tax=Kribbella sancticallisti TaxID=460087 RepID=A0ABP4QA59_9ACTN